MLFQRTFKMSKDVPTLVSSKSCPIVSTAVFEKKKPCGIISPSAHRKHSGAGAARGPRPSRRCCSRTCAARDIMRMLLLPQQTSKQCLIKNKMQFHAENLITNLWSLASVSHPGSTRTPLKRGCGCTGPVLDSPSYSERIELT